MVRSHDQVNMRGYSHDPEDPGMFEKWFPLSFRGVRDPIVPLATVRSHDRGEWSMPPACFHPGTIKTADVPRTATLKSSLQELKATVARTGLSNKPDPSGIDHASQGARKNVGESGHAVIEQTHGFKGRLV